MWPGQLIVGASSLVTVTLNEHVATEINQPTNQSTNQSINQSIHQCETHNTTHTTVAGRIGDVERVCCCANRKQRSRRATSVLVRRLTSTVVGANRRCVRHDGTTRVVVVARSDV
jgi:hypothetical protein